MSNSLPGRVCAALEVIGLLKEYPSDSPLNVKADEADEKKDKALRRAAKNVLLEYLLGESLFQDDKKVDVGDDEDNAGGKVVVKV